MNSIRATWCCRWLYPVMLLAALFSAVTAESLEREVSLQLHTNRITFGGSVPLSLTLGRDLGDARIANPEVLSTHPSVRRDFSIPSTPPVAEPTPGGLRYDWPLRPNRPGRLEVPALPIVLRERTHGHQERRHSDPIPLDVVPDAGAGATATPHAAPAALAMLTGDGLDTRERVFLWKSALAQSIQARTPVERRRAAAAHLRLIRTGVRHGDAFYNLGTAWWVAGEPASALAALQLAEHRLGARADVRMNQRLARKALGLRRPWSYRLAPWHHGLCLRARRVLLIGAIIGLGLLAILSRLGRRIPVGLLGGGLACVALLALSVGATLRLEARALRALEPPPPAPRGRLTATRGSRGPAYH